MFRRDKRAKVGNRPRINLEQLEDRNLLAVGDALGNSVNIAAGGVGSNHNSLFQDYGGAATLSNDNIVVAWRSRDNDAASPSTADGDDYGAFFQVFTSAGAASSGPIFPYVDINASGTGKQGTPKVTALTGGGFALAWNSAGGPGDVYVDGNGRGGDTYVRVFDNTGSGVSSTTKVNEATSDEEVPIDIISLTGGGFAVIYEDENDNTNNKDDLFVRAYNASGVAQGASVRLGGTGHDAFFMDYGGAVALSNGGFAVGWRTRDDGATPSPDGAGDGSFFQVFNASGATVASASSPYGDTNSSGTGDQSAPKLAALSGGGFALTWSSDGGPSDAGGGDTYTRVFSNTGTSVSSTTRVNEATSDEEIPTAIVGSSSGGFAIVYRDDNNNTNNKDDFFFRAYSSTGTAEASSTRLGGTGHDAFFMDFGELISLTNGNYATAWRTRDDGATPSPDGDDYGAFYQVFSSSGSTVASAATPYADINSGGTGKQGQAQLAPIAGGGFAMIWNSAGGPGDVFVDGNGRGGDTYVRLFDNSGTALASTTKVNESEPTGTNDEQLPQEVLGASDGDIVVVYKDDNENTDNKDDYFLRAFEGVAPDTVTQTPTLSAPTSSSTHNSAFTITYSLPETPLSGSVSLTFAGTTTVTLTMADSQSASFSLDPTTDPAALAEVLVSTASSIPDDTYTVTLSYQDANGNSAATAVATNVVLATNTAPTLSAPTDVTVTEDIETGVDLSSVVIADVDGDQLTLTLVASAGSFRPPGDGSLIGDGVTANRVSSTEITLVGSAADIISYLNAGTQIRYTGAANVFGDDAATIQLTVSDGSDDSTATVNVDITAVNDLADITGVPAIVTVFEDTESDVDLSAITLSDVDDDELELLVFLDFFNHRDKGVFSTPIDGSGVGAGVETERLDHLITLRGLATDINTYLSNPSNLKFTPTSNLSGEDLFGFGISLGDGSGTGQSTSTQVDVTPVNDPPTLVATGTNPTFTEGGLGVDLFSGVTADTFEDGQLLTGFTVTTNVLDLTETLTIDGNAIALSDGNVGDEGVTSTNGLAFDVAVSSGTATVTFSNGTLSEADFQSLIDGMTYSNSSNNPTTTQRTVTITSLTDDGGTDNGGVDTVSLSLSSTVSVVADVNASIPDTDFLIIMDTSGGTSTAELQTQVDFVTDLIQTGIPQTDRVGIITFDTGARLYSNLSNDHATVRASVLGVQESNGFSHVDDALDLAIATFAETSGPFTSRAVLLLAEDAASTDHVLCSLDDNPNLVSNLDAAEVQRIVVGVGSSFREEDFRCVVDDPDEQIVLVDSFNAVSTLGAIQRPIEGEGLVTDLSFTEDTTGNLDLSIYDFSGVVSDLITLSLSVDDGVFSTPADGAGVGGGVTENLVDGDTITLTGDPEDVTAYLSTTTNIQYTGSLNTNGDDVATLTMQVTAGADSVTLEPVNIDIAAVNDPAVITGVPNDVTVTEDTESPFDLSSVSVAEADGDALLFAVAVGEGTFATPADGSGIGAGVVATLAVDPRTVTLQGLAEDISTYLGTPENIRLLPALHANGDDATTFQIAVSDTDPTPIIASGSVDITPVNDLPEVSGVPLSLNFTEDTTGNVDLSAISVSDVEGDQLTVTLTVDAGTFSTPGTSGTVNTTLVDSQTITLIGSAADLNTYFDTVDNIQYTGALNANGTPAATLTVEVADADSVEVTVDLNISGVNDAPILETTRSLLLGSIPEDPVINPGTLVGDISTLFSITDPDGQPTGIAVTSVDNSNGEWQYSLDDGFNWTSFSFDRGVLNIESAARLLSSSDRIRYQPDFDTNGTAPFEFRAWDQSTGTIGDVFDASVNGGATAFSSGLGTATITVTSVNDPPSAMGNVLTIDEDTPTAIFEADIFYFDAEGDPLDHMVIQTLPANGTLFVDANNNDAFDQGEELAANDQVSGTDINAGNFFFVPAADESGFGYANFEFLVSDGTDVSEFSGFMSFDVNAVNDAPSGTGLPSDVTVPANASSEFDLSTVTLTDPEDDPLRVLLVVSKGSFTSIDADGVTVTGSDSGALELTGSPSDLNAFLDNPTNITYTPGQNQSGDDSAIFLMHVHDGSMGSIVGYGNVHVEADQDIIDLEVNAVADARIALEGQTFAWSVVVTNRSSETVNASATGIEIYNVFPPELELVTTTSTNGTAVGPVWTLSDPIEPGATASLTMLANLSDTVVAGDSLRVFAYAQAATETDVDSTPGTRDIAEDDADVFTITVGPRPPERPSVPTVASDVAPTITIDGNQVIAVATPGDDVVEFRAGTVTHTLNISGHEFEFDASVITEINIGGSAGENRVLLIGTAGDESGMVNGPRASLTDGTYTVNTFSFDETFIDGGDGNDVVQLFGSTEDDTLTVLPEAAKMETPEFSYLVDNTERVDSFGRGGDDSATLFGTAGTETFVSLVNEDQFRSLGNLFTANGFKTVDVHSGGGHDRAQVHDSVGDDTFVASGDLATMSSTNRVRNVFDYVHVIASSINGGTDQATLSGVAGVRDVFVSGVGFSEMIGARNRNRAEGFAVEVATSNDGRDQASFVGLTDLETFVADGSTASVEGERSTRAEGFERVSAANGVDQTPVGDLSAVDFVLRIIGDWA